MKRLLALLLGPLTTAATASDSLDFELGRYLGKYPAMYVTALVSQDPRDRSFDAAGNERDSALPSFGNGVELPETRLETTLEWFFPWFESAAVPLVSDRLWTARATLGYARLDTQGPVDAFIADNGLIETGDGVTDVALSFGPVLYGSKDWRTRPDMPLSVLLLLQAALPVGERDPDSPNNAGGNVAAYGAELGAHWRPWAGWHLDAGARWRGFARNDEAAFGGHEPSQRGSEIVFDATLARRFLHDGYASLSWRDSRGDDNEYDNPRFAANAPQPSFGNEVTPVPGVYRDDGTGLSELAAALHWFLTPSLRVGVHYIVPLAGESGSFSLPYQQQVMNCRAFGTCNPQPAGSAAVDGTDGARRYASDRLMLGIAWNFGQGDIWGAP